MDTVKRVGGNFLGRLKNVKKPILVLICVAIVALIVGIVFLVMQMNHNSSTTTSVQKATATKGTVSTTVSGSGTLAAGTTANVEVPTGILVESVAVSSGDKVTAGQTLATLNTASIASALISTNASVTEVEEEIANLGTVTDTTSTEYLESIIYNTELSELQTKQAQLNAYLESPVITATSAGTIGTVGVTAGSTTSSGTSSSNSSSGSSTGTSSGSSSSASKTSSNLGAVGSDAVYSVGATEASTAALATTATAFSYSTLTTAYDEATKTMSTQLVSDDSTVTLGSDNTTITGLDLTVTAPVTGKRPESALAASDAYASSISWNCSSSTFQANTAYTATIVLTAKDNYTFYDNILPSVSGATVTADVQSDPSGTANKILVIRAAFSNTAAASSGSSGSSSSGSSSGNSSGTSASSGSASGSSSGSSSGTSSSGSSSSASGSSSSSSSSATYSSNKEATAFTIVSDTDATVTLSINEDDILSIKKGESATVTLDALDGESFKGTVTSVSGSSTSSSSSSTSSGSSSSSVRYKAVITLSKTDEMLIGMSATATIAINESDNAITIPAAALQERGNTTFVYTALDSSGNPTGETTVQTGLSDGSSVEITSGLNEGDTVYYTRTVTTSSTTTSTGSSSSKSSTMGAMGGGSSGTGGGNGGGGTPPSGSGGGPGGSTGKSS